MPWQATLTAVSSSDNPHQNTIATVQYTDGTRLYDTSYSLTPPASVDAIKARVKDELVILQYRDDNTVSLSSLIGITVQISSGQLVVVPSSSVFPRPSTA